MTSAGQIIGHSNAIDKLIADGGELLFRSEDAVLHLEDDSARVAPDVQSGQIALLGGRVVDVASMGIAQRDYIVRCRESDFLISCPPQSPEITTGDLVTINFPQNAAMAYVNGELV